MKPAPRQPYKRPVSVLVVIHHRAQWFLMLQRCDNALFWQSVTGSLEQHETPQEAAMRELHEETGLLVTPEQMVDWHKHYQYDIYPEYWHRYQPGTRQNTEHVFSVEVALDANICLAAREHQAYRWADGITALDLAYSPSNRRAIEELIVQAAL